MKKSNHFLLLAFFSLVVFLTPGCKKVDVTPVITPPPPADTLLKVKLNGQVVTSTYSVQVSNGNSVHLQWTYVGPIPLLIMSNKQKFSEKTIGDTTFFVTEKKVFTFLVQGVLQKPQITLSPTPKPTCVVGYDHNTIAYNGNTQFSWDMQYVTQATLNNVPVDTVGLKTLNHLVADTTFTFRFSGPGGKDSVSFTFHVAQQPVPTTTDSLQAIWLLKDILYKYIGSNVFVSWVEPCEADDYMNINTESSYEAHQGTAWCFVQGPEYVVHGWSLLPKRHISLGGADYKFKLTSTSLELIDTISSGSVSESKLIYQKQQKK